MKPIRNWENVQEPTKFKRLAPGGYICAIKDVRNVEDKKYIQVSYIDDFGIQLKRFGDYNHKYFYSHQELISEDNGSISDVHWSNQNKKNINKQPVLLGSLVYDKEWIDNKMEE